MQPATDKNEKEIAVAWHRFYNGATSTNSGDHEDRWAFEYVRHLLHDRLLSNEGNQGIIDNPCRLWEIILALLRESPSRDGVITVAADPLRKLLDAYFEEFIEVVEFETKRNPRLSFALSQVFVQNEEQSELIKSLGCRAANLTFPNDLEQERTDRFRSNWLSFHRHELIEQRDEQVIVVMELYDLPETDPCLCWKIVQSLLESAMTEDELLEIGEIITLLLQWNYYDFIDDIKRGIPLSRRLAHALSELELPAELEAEWLELMSLVTKHQARDPFSLGA